MEPSEIRQHMEKLGIDPTDATEAGYEKFYTLIQLSTAHLRYLKDRGDIQFTPTRIREDLDHDLAFNDWMDESFEEWAFG